MDYKEILRKYIIHVGQCEGTTFISKINSKWYSDVKFTDEEKEELKKLDW
jgi:hypothetical protein